MEILKQIANEYQMVENHIESLENRIKELENQLKEINDEKDLVRIRAVMKESEMMDFIREEISLSLDGDCIVEELKDSIELDTDSYGGEVRVSISYDEYSIKNCIEGIVEAEIKEFFHKHQDKISILVSDE